MIIHMRHTLWTGISETNVNIITSATRTHAFNNNNNMIQVLIEKVMGIGGQSLVTFIDYSKAFYSISHVQRFDIMLERGLPEHIVPLLQ